MAGNLGGSPARRKDSVMKLPERIPSSALGPRLGAALVGLALVGLRGRLPRGGRILAGALAAVSVGLAVGLPPAAPPAEAQPRPNILLVLTDDQRPEGTMAVMRKTRRWLKTTGVHYPNAFVTTPLCCPSRASILTGQYAHNHGVEDNQKPFNLDQNATLQRYLQDAGYRTGLVGKYLNGWNPATSPPHFDRWSLFSPLEFAPGYRNNVFNVNGQLKRVKMYSTDYLARRSNAVLRWFENDDASPWMLLVWPFAPHGPFVVERQYQKAKVGRWTKSPAVLESDRTDKPAYVQSKFRSLKTASAIRRSQLRMLMSADDLVEGVRQQLGKLGERERTLVVFTSDNGYTWGEHGWIDKRLPYTNSIKVPLLVRWAGHLPGGVSDTRMVTNLDLAATLFDAAGVSPSHPLDGRSLLQNWQRQRVLLEYWANAESIIPTWRSIRTATEQYIETYHEATGAIASQEYYDLLSDPYQLTNLLGDADPANDPRPDRVASLSLQIEGDRECQGTTGPEACP
jgi:arylsulfatase A-like enzyme